MLDEGIGDVSFRHEYSSNGNNMPVSLEAFLCDLLWNKNCRNNASRKGHRDNIFSAIYYHVSVSGPILSSIDIVVYILGTVNNVLEILSSVIIASPFARALGSETSVPTINCNKGMNIRYLDVGSRCIDYLSCSL